MNLPKIKFDATHFPTLMLIIGYPVYWLELYLFKGAGQTTWLAVALLFFMTVYMLLTQLKAKNIFKLQGFDRIEKYWFWMSLGLSVCILAIAFYAASLAPHLAQESDALNYHITLPRQHLLTHSFQHIPWATADLFVLPVQFALAPFWLATDLPNKWPQFFFLIGIFFVANNLMKYFEVKSVNRWLVIFAIMGTHSVGIQMGTAMIDLVIAYLFLAALDSFFKGNIFLAAVEFTFFFWSKPFVPLQITLIGIVLILLFYIFKRMKGGSMSWDFGNAVPAVKFRDMIPSLKKFFLLFTIASLFIGGPFVLKSLYYSGTPLYPFAAAKVSEEPFQSLVRASESYVATKNNYGHGISLVAFLKHLWLIAVPEKGVNNSFDYPQGLPYLLFIGPFIYFLFRSLSERKFPLIPLFIALYWLVWWFGSQQTRFLYIPLILMYIVVAPKLKPSKILMGIMTLALFLNFLSVYRANRRDFGVPYSQMLREKDVSLIEMNKQYRNQGKTIDLPFGDVAFAQFPVNVTEERLPFVIAVQKEK